jgi:tRNA (guanine-N7-)-methyltransferase
LSASKTGDTQGAPGGFSRRPPHSYGRRRGRKLRPGQASLLETKLSAVELKPPFDLAAAFGAFPARLWLEIGFGGGEHLAHQAAANPDVTLIGAEPFVNGVVSALRHLETRKLANARLYRGDARDLFGAIPDAALEKIFVLHPDPWPKARHHKRRLIQKPFLDEAARMLRPDGELRLATDDPDYLVWMLRHVLAHPAFEWTAKTAEDWRRIPADGIETRYGKKSREEGRPATCLRLKRRRA